MVESQISNLIVEGSSPFVHFFKCEKCGRSCKSFRGMKIHEARCQISEFIVQQIKKLYEDGVPIPKIKEFGYKITSIKYVIKSCKKRKIKLSNEHKKKISRAQIEICKKGEHQGWSFKNSDPNRRSYPEKYFVNFFELESLNKRYLIKEKLNVGKYFLDFAIIDLKLDIEIDGQQHYRSKENIEHDAKRDAYLRSLGWKIYRVCWVNVCKNSNKEKQELLTFIKNIDDRQDRYYNINDIKTIKDKILEEKQKRLQIKEKRIQEKINAIKISKIDFLKFGWVDQASKILNIRQQKVASWMKKYMPEFYKESCFKRKLCPRSSVV